MPYTQDIRCGGFTIELNCNSIIHYIEESLDTEYTGDCPEKGSKIWMYVYCLENAVNQEILKYPELMKEYGIWSYIEDLYDEIDAWNDIKEFFIGDYGCSDEKEEE